MFLLSRVKMVDYEVTISTSFLDNAGTSDNVFIKLVGRDGKSEHTKLEGGSSFARGAVSHFTVSCPASIGKLLQIQLNKQHFPEFPEDSKWWPTKVVVKSPEGDTYKFPICRWINDSEVYCFTEERVNIKSTVESEVNERKWGKTYPVNDDYRWHEPEEKIPHYLEAESFESLPDGKFSYCKDKEFDCTLYSGLAEIYLKGLDNNKETWADLDDINGVFLFKRTDISDYVQKHWKEDAFFGYQYLNGVNPMLIRRCSALPENFPVTDDAVSLSLTDEMKEGNIFLCDYKSLDGLTPNTIDGKKQYLMAPLVLLHKTPDKKLMPIAIQLKQTPADDNPIFYPTDSEYDWLMAKIFVRGADFHEHELNVHLLRTHLLAEVFAVSLLRNVREWHPLYKLLVHHTRYTLHINYKARELLISGTGFFKQYAASGGDAMKRLLEGSTASLTYSSLCIHEDIAERGLEAVPNFHYRDDGLKLWDIIHRFVQGILSFYYRTDTKVQNDTLVQRWISDIFKHGFLSQTGTGIPQSFTTVKDLVKFVTMVIFTCSAQHSAVSAGLYDYGGWMPNNPTTLRLPPPTRKGTTSEDTMLKTLPVKGTTANEMAVLWLLSKQSSDSVFLGQYGNDHFSEEIPRQLMKAFQGRLQVLSAYINIRNKNLKVPYRYLDPDVVENSVSI
ncbi:polyunsaturated fatty acid lipoxygenase ALOX15B-like [Sebastes umbrosus]|uniref:polyunsaturated fatty acid lipoxygenase ALOX15B-like n=1 Tax=Sebastes umbrosus TaxID=72105 RepID=UPI00189FD6EC|nr:polyunsaturated fatty acid lipoxygenase ALOX15B-like [Sebastes umbrosus]